MSDQKANLFVVGAMRSGTTSFMDLLSKHPDIYTSPIKEPHHFVPELPSEIFEPQPNFNMEAYLANDFPKTRHRAHVTDAAHYKALFSLSTIEKYRAEGSVTYLHAPGTAQRIAEYEPSAKVIILLRKPLKRLISHYQMDVGLLIEKRSLDEVISDDLILYQNHALPWFSHLGMSLYNNAIEIYQEQFGENVLVIESEKFFADSNEVMDQVALFLDIKPFGNIAAVHKNESRNHRFPKFFKLIKRSGITKFFPNSIKKVLWKKLSSKIDTPPKLSNHHANELKALFEKELESSG